MQRFVAIKRNESKIHLRGYNLRIFPTQAIQSIFFQKLSLEHPN